MAINLITSGCSFTAHKGCWPWWLIRKIRDNGYKQDLSLINNAVGGSDNQLIARKTIHAVNKLFKKRIEPKDIIVGVMWSGHNRKSFYSDDKLTLVGMFKGQDSKMPHKWPPNDRKGRWLLMTPNSALHGSYPEHWYKWLHSEPIAKAETYEQILRVQWFLEKHKIKYFMQTHRKDLQNTYDSHPQVTYLKQMIDWSKFVNTSCYEWIKQNSKLSWTEYDDIRRLKRKPGDEHPTSYQQQEYVEEVLWPFLIEKGIIDG